MAMRIIPCDFSYCSATDWVIPLIPLYKQQGLPVNLYDRVLQERRTGKPSAVVVGCFLLSYKMFTFVHFSRSVIISITKNRIPSKWSKSLLQLALLSCYVAFEFSSYGLDFKQRCLRACRAHFEFISMQFCHGVNPSERFGMWLLHR